MEDRETKIWNCLIQQDGETVARLLTQYHGNQLFDKGFLEHLVDEGYLEAEDDDEDDEEPEDEYPDDGDYIISDSPPLGSKTLVCVKEGRWNDGERFHIFDTEEEAVKAIKEDMAAQRYWPNVWYESDHGNLSHYDVGENEPRR